MDGVDREMYFGSFEERGEDLVRVDLALKRYRDEKVALAYEWLESRSRTKDSAFDEQLSQQRRTDARNAKTFWVSVGALGISVFAFLLNAESRFRGYGASPSTLPAATTALPAPAQTPK